MSSQGESNKMMKYEYAFLKNNIFLPGSMKLTTIGETGLC